MAISLMPLVAPPIEIHDFLAVPFVAWLLSHDLFLNFGTVVSCNEGLG